MYQILFCSVVGFLVFCQRILSARCVCIPRQFRYNWSLQCFNITKYMPKIMGHNQGGTGDTTASGSKESCLGFPVLLCQTNTKSIGHFYNLKLDGYKNERFNEGSFYSAFHFCYKFYPKSAQVHKIALDQIQRRLGAGLGGCHHLSLWG